MNMLRCLCMATLLVTCVTAAQSKSITLHVTVTSVAGKSAFIDQGRNVGIAPGLRIRFFPAGMVPIDGVVADVASSSARVDIIGSVMPAVATQGDVEVVLPDKPTTATTRRARPATVPAHPPWERKEQERTADMPLLAPAFSLAPNQRASTTHGRVYTDFDFSRDRGDSRDNRYLLARTGVSITRTNPFEQGGELTFEGEYDYRNLDVSEGDSDTRNDFLLLQLSYSIGTEEYSPYRLELGRFTSYYLPEIGWVDGLEGAIRFQNGLSLGGGFGGYPRPSLDQDTGEDLGFHVFADYSSKTPFQLNGTVGYQKTWHGGSPDRDVLVARGNMSPTKSLWLYGSLITDLYTSSDSLKSNGPQVTGAWLQARYSPTNHAGAAISYSDYSWADIQARDYPPVPDSIIHSGRVDRVELSVWRDVFNDIRPTAKLRYYDRDHGNGFGGELDLDWLRVGGRSLTWHNAVFYADGDYTKDWGFRTQASLVRGNFDFTLGYEFLTSDYPYTDLDSGGFTRHNIQGGVGWQHGNWYYNITANYYFGDAENSFDLRAYVEYRF